MMRVCGWDSLALDSYEFWIFANMILNAWISQKAWHFPPIDKKLQLTIRSAIAYPIFVYRTLAS